MPNIDITKDATFKGARILDHGSKKIRACKIVATLGPASSNEQTLRELVEAGINIVRLNFSHGEHSTHLKNIELVRKISRETGRHIAILQDLQGPKIRVGKLIGEQMELVKGQSYLLQFGVDQTTAGIIPIDYRGLVHDVRAGDLVMMDDGLLICEVKEVRKDAVEVVVQEGGILKNRKGVNFPNSTLSLPALTDKDSKDLLFGIANRVDFVALSFVQTPADIQQIKGMISVLGSEVPVIAKIEKLSAMDHIDEIAKLADGLMVARGDLGVEANVERVPRYQRAIVEAAAKYAKPCIIATQMLDSMIRNPRATLAEVADVANGVLDGADCLMLSGESASGKYPIKSVARMASIIHEVEDWTFSHPPRFMESSRRELDTNSWEEHESIARAACEAAHALNAKAIVCLTLTGSMARSIARWRPNTAIIAISPRQDVVQRLTMVWGVYGIPNPSFYNADVLLQELPNLLRDLEIIQSGDFVVITAGIPFNQMRSSNTIKINRIP